jgi:hypothetical protein
MPHYEFFCHTLQEALLQDPVPRRLRRGGCRLSALPQQVLLQRVNNPLFHFSTPQPRTRAGLRHTRRRQTPHTLLLYIERSPQSHRRA